MRQNVAVIFRVSRFTNGAPYI